MDSTDMTQQEHIKTQVNRLGFGAWAENIIINFMEDWGDTMRTSEGNMTIENDCYTLNAKFGEGDLYISIRAYVQNDGWQELQQNIHLK